MLYPESKQPFSEEVFAAPPANYRAAPFWAWNTRMTHENADRTIESLRKMGMGGATLHCRTGLETPYLGEEFMEIVRYSHEQLRERKMLTWLYDEDRWPSGAGGGYVTKDHQYRIRFLVFSPEPLEGKDPATSEMSSSGSAVRSTERKRLARYGVRLDAEGYLRDYRQLAEGETAAADEGEWFAYLEVSGDNPWFNNEAYLNTLDPKAVEKFIEVTHEAYYRELGADFGKDVPAIFTDEPQFCHKTRLRFAQDRSEVILPFTDDLEESFAAQYGHSLLAHLPELFWELPGEAVSVYRYEYHDHIAERFASAFADTIGKWCRAHGIMLTGHMMEEPTLRSQTAALGEAMRSYRGFDLPGIDLLCDERELTTAKQAQSASRQFGRPGVLSELYGVTNWDFDFRGHKLQGDWQAALGITVRVPHLTWTTMAGEAKRDYPASIGMQSPWYQEYPMVEDHFARVNTAMTRGQAVSWIAVIHPIETYWLYWGSEEKTGAVRAQLDQKFKELTETMLLGLLDFDFVCESLLPQLQKEASAEQDGAPKFCVGKMQYDVVFVPNCRTLRSSTLDALESFKAAGGRVVFIGDLPTMENARPSERAQALAADCEQIAADKESILQAAQPYRFVDVRMEDGNRSENLIYQLRRDGAERWLFLSHVYRMKNPDTPHEEKVRVTLQGAWRVTEYDTLTGQVRERAAVCENGTTQWTQSLYEHDSLLLRLRPSEENVDKTDRNDKDGGKEPTARDTWKPFDALTTAPRVPVTLAEPNVLLLDQFEYNLDGGDWQPREEVLRIDNLFRAKLGYPQRMEAYAQPWVEQEQESGAARHTLRLRAKIFSEIEVAQVWLGIEEAERAAITFNGAAVEIPALAEGHEPAPADYYVDPAIRKIALGALHRGENELVVTIDFCKKGNVEAMYLLGDFGVYMSGAWASVTAPVRELTFGDIAPQGLPFYGGNLTYHVDFALAEEKELALAVTMFRSPVLDVAVDGEKKGCIAFSPYRLPLGRLTAGAHRADITMAGSRINTFGGVHNCDESMRWFGPNGWRTEGDAWAYEYQLRRVGVLKTPVLLEREE